MPSQTRTNLIWYTFQSLQNSVKWKIASLAQGSGAGWGPTVLCNCWSCHASPVWAIQQLCKCLVKSENQRNSNRGRGMDYDFSVSKLLSFHQSHNFNIILDYLALLQARSFYRDGEKNMKKNQSKPKNWLERSCNTLYFLLIEEEVVPHGRLMISVQTEYGVQPESLNIAEEWEHAMLMLCFETKLASHLGTACVPPHLSLMALDYVGLCFLCTSVVAHFCRGELTKVFAIILILLPQK